jgi:hypothetical protein
MERGRGNQRSDPSSGSPAREAENDGGGRLPALPELMRRALSLGLSGFFLTEEAVRKALGDTLPKDWIDFAVEQSERTRKEFLERLTFEIAQSLQATDLASVVRELLEGRTLELKTEIRLRDEEPESGASGRRAAPRADKKDE